MQLYFALSGVVKQIWPEGGEKALKCTAILGFFSVQNQIKIYRHKTVPFTLTTKKAQQLTIISIL